MNKTTDQKLVNKLCLVIFFELLFELLAINFLKAISEYNNLIFLALSKSLFLILLIILNKKLTRQQIPFSLKLNREQQKLIGVLIAGLVLIGLINKKNILMAITIGLIASTTEEYLFRGIVLVALLKLSYQTKKAYMRILIPIIISSMLFGLEHFLNLYSQNLNLTIIQVCQTMAMGYIFASIFLRTKNLLFSMICHFSLDFIVTIFWGMKNDPGASMTYSIVPILIYLILGSIILVPVLTEGSLKIKK
jgi:membrane protease YdiL (CAAX protease family)